MSILIIRCPPKPFNEDLTSSIADWQDLLCAERFEWHLLDDQLDDQALKVLESGMGSTESMPYADEVLALMPTIDVRMIVAKVPLVSSKKLQQILPTIIEEYVLAGIEAITVQALPPVPGESGLERTLALMDRNWFTWLTGQLEKLLSQKVRLIPDCLLLALPGNTAEAVSITYQIDAHHVTFTQRTGEQIGHAWIERMTSQEIVLPQVLANQLVIAFSWDWLLPNARKFIQNTSHSRSQNFALNLLPDAFKDKNKSGYLSNVFSVFSNDKSVGGSTSSSLAWMDPLTWKRTAQWVRLSFFAIAIAYGAHLAWQVADNWRWTNQMELLATRSLSSASVSFLAQEKKKSGDSVTANNVLTTFVKQVTQDQRALGFTTDADFIPMAAKLHQLKQAFGKGALQQIDYDGYNLSFQLKPGKGKQTPQDFIRIAREMGLALTVLGPNRYRLEAYAGIGAGL